MKEIDTSADAIKGHLRLGWDDLRRDIYRLFTHFHGSAALAQRGNEDTDAYRDTWQEKWSRGRLFEDSRNKEHTSLSVREACNKVIHARVVNFCRTGFAEENEEIFPLMPTVVLYGSRSRSTIVWKCELEINQFLDSAFAIAEYTYGPLWAKPNAQ